MFSRKESTYRMRDSAITKWEGDANSGDGYRSFSITRRTRLLCYRPDLSPGVKTVTGHDIMAPHELRFRLERGASTILLVTGGEILVSSSSLDKCVSMVDLDLAALTGGSCAQELCVTVAPNGGVARCIFFGVKIRRGLAHPLFARGISVSKHLSAEKNRLYRDVFKRWLVEVAWLESGARFLISEPHGSVWFQVVSGLVFATTHKIARTLGSGEGMRWCRSEEVSSFAQKRSLVVALADNRTSDNPLIETV